MKKRFQLGTKKQAFSIAYAIVALIVVGVLIAGLTPVLTRKLPNLATSQMIKNPKGWYESYNAPPDNSKGNGTDGKPCKGNPTCNYKYDNTDDLVPFDRYCKGNDSCTEPNQCKDGLCHFEPRQGITKYEVFAIGGGGAAGSATKGDTNTVNKPLNTLTTDAAKKDKNNFIDTNRTNTNVQTDIAKSKDVEDGTIPPNTDLNINSASNFFFTVSEKKRNFHIYPTEDLNFELSKISKKQIQRINKETYDGEYGKITCFGKNCINPELYYLYTLELGTLKYNQNPKYTLMPEWLKVDGTEKRYPCLDKTNIDKECSNDDETPNLNGGGDILSTTILNKFSHAAAVACSGRGGNASGASYGETGTMCFASWVVKGCSIQGVQAESCSTPSNVVESRSPCDTSTAVPVCNTGHTETVHNKTVCNPDCHEEYDYTTYSCTYKGSYDCHRTCVFNVMHPSAYSVCTCDNHKIEGDKGTCEKTSSDGAMLRDKCLPNHENKTLDSSSSADEWAAADSYAQSLNDVGFGGAVAGRTGGRGEGFAVTDISGLMTPGGGVTYLYQYSATAAKCSRVGSYSTSAAGSVGGAGLCVYVSKTIANDKVHSVNYSPSGTAHAGESHDGVNSGSGGNGHSSWMGQDGGDGGDAWAQIDSCRIDASGGKGGTKGVIGDTCQQGSETDGQDGAPGSETISGCDPDLGENAQRLGTVADGQEIAGIAGSKQTPGKYNWRYIWYMPFVTKHLMFGEAGLPGEEIHTMITLSEGQNLDINPGKSAKKTDYKSGANGGNGEPSTIKNDSANVNYAAPGGLGGLSNQKTDEYVLCHILDKVEPTKDASGKITNRHIPCINIPKQTHEINPEGKLTGIQAIRPKESITANSIKMSKALRNSRPGLGSMGYGTKSVNDFVCNNRRIEKWDVVNGADTSTTIYSKGGSGCDNNAQIEYILPTGAMYTAGTGAVIILW